MTTYSINGSDIHEEEAAAAIAAVSSVLADEAAWAAAQAEPTAPKRWHAATRLITQGIIPTRLPTSLGWGSIERLRRATRGSGGIVGQ
ncbi:hypothetical protein [Candidatus Viridilinea mediisalina]|uniref:Uncharacterized protein n=1 Tax=Candidatus Viridilinea mediisalina TaxID=2024553 RepID=A0A2A6REI0_9CHLR|nr:hypothetical protein [Candidatus Viridilinea mediisalina]PDW01467.1 hypothetical protein CJ255_18985 [Candidatus Viridilinea mediisalina]